MRKKRTIQLCETPTVLPPFSFAEAEPLSPSERIDSALEEIAREHKATDYAQWFGSVPPLPPVGATETEILEREQLENAPLPDEYRLFLRRCRYLAVREGILVNGFDWKGYSICRPPWVSTAHLTDRSYWIIGEYWDYSDGDDLLIPVGEATVYVYLHEFGPTIERFADSFSLALWRLAYERR